jgi:hypothetical protein
MENSMVMSKPHAGELHMQFSAHERHAFYCDILIGDYAVGRTTVLRVGYNDCHIAYDIPVKIVSGWKIVYP